MVFMYVLAFYWAAMLVWITYFAVVTTMSSHGAQGPTQRIPGGDGGGGGDAGGGAVGGGGGDGSGDGGTTTAAGGRVEGSAGCSVPSAAAHSAAAAGGESPDEDVVCGTSPDRENAGAGAIYPVMHEGQAAPGAGADGLFQRKGVAEAGVAE